MNNPSKIAELQELEQWRTKFDVASAAAEGFFSKRWIATNLFNISEEEYIRNQREQYHDRLVQAELDQSSEAIGAEGGLGGGGGLDDLMGDEAGEDSLDDIAGDEAGEEAAPTPPGEDESSLLAAPANRDDQEWRKVVKVGGKEVATTSGAKGKWSPVKKDLSGKRAMQRSMSAQAGTRMSSASEKNIHKGYQNLSRAAKGIYNESQSIYDTQEDVFNKNNNNIKNLITELESKENVDKTEA
tara:strand:- start:631 stop:1356 length:726 start_codon:yes stop_codon:yes gene_type:complete